MKKKPLLALSVGALGVVFGDIGTSPLYAMRETLGDLPITEIDVFGVLSLIFWSLIIVISIKYLALVFRADNEGEGGVLALLALVKQQKSKHDRLFYFVAIFGAGLLLGDAMLTPAISVTSAIEGLETISPKFSSYVVPLSCTILVLLFMMQSRGTEKIGATFGPLLFIWFAVIAVLGIIKIVEHPEVLQAINPYYAFEFFHETGMKGFFLLGGVFLVVTGGEALYSDLGHFGKLPIRLSWFFVALPCLVLNYFGQGAHLLHHHDAIANPFFMIAPDWFYLPLVIISTIATVIASQAVISAAFSLTRQAILLGLCPRLPVIQTCREQVGQIYIPHMNFLLLVGTLLLVMTFKNTSAMTHAYGIAVNLVMFLVTCMVAYAANKVWKWSWVHVFLIFSGFIIIDLAFLGANSHKFLTGGWVPVSFALVISFIMYTWSLGLKYLKENFYMQKEHIFKIINQLHRPTLNQLPGVTAIFITDTYDPSGGSFLHFLKLSRALPENILIVNYRVENKPHIPISERFSVSTLDKNVSELTLHYGFMDTISIPHALTKANEKKILPFEVRVDMALFLVDVPNIMASRAKKTLLFYSQERLFAFLMRNYNANLNIEFYNLPYNRTIAIGSYCIM